MGLIENPLALGVAPCILPGLAWNLSNLSPMALPGRKRLAPLFAFPACLEACIHEVTVAPRRGNLGFETERSKRLPETP